MKYKETGVDVVAGERFASFIAKHAGSQKAKELISGIGGFAALWDLEDGRYLASSTDGVGTKLLLAQELDQHGTIGQDLVAMVVNDLLCVGAKPLFFLDYMALGKLEKGRSEEILKGILKACNDSSCVLIGGETAEMPDLYKKKHYDLAGFAVGMVEQDKCLPKAELIQDGDFVLGLESSGAHSNGFSLLRKLFQKNEKDWFKRLLVPTHLYTQKVHEFWRAFPDQTRAAVHVTGGGVRNLFRLGSDFGFDLCWPKTDALQDERSKRVFQEIYSRTEDESDLFETFNMGIGFCLVLHASSQSEKKSMLKFFETTEFRAHDLGSVTTSHKKVVLKSHGLEFSEN